MWCDNCLLIFPLRYGSMALAVLIGLYNLAGAILLFLYGMTLFYNDLEYQIYGGIGIGVFAMCLLTLFAHSNNSYLWTRVLFILWPFILVVVAIRAGFMLFMLNRNKDGITWSCDHGGQIYNSTAIDLNQNTTLAEDATRIPQGFCNSGFSAVYTAFAFALAVDLGLQLYQYFLSWRMKARIEHSYEMVRKQNFGNGMYA